MVIHLGKPFARIDRLDETALRAAGAGRVEILVSSDRARDAGVAGLEFLRGIPGTVGGFVRMNGGAYGREVRDILASARLALRSGEIVEWPLDRLGYTYRHGRATFPMVRSVELEKATFRGSSGDPSAIGAEMDAIARARGRIAAAAKSHRRLNLSKNPPGHKAWALVDAAQVAGVCGWVTPSSSEKHCNFLLDEVARPARR